MNKKSYQGLEAEIISFGTEEINTVTVVAYSGCKLGAVSYYTEDGNGNPLPLGVCWESQGDGSTGGYSFDWETYSGTVS